MNTKTYNLKNYEIVVPETMLVGITDDKLKMIVADEKANQIHCIFEIKDGKLILNNGWDSKYTIDGHRIVIEYVFEEDCLGNAIPLELRN